MYYILETSRSILGWQTCYPMTLVVIPSPSEQILEKNKHGDHENAFCNDTVSYKYKAN